MAETATYDASLYLERSFEAKGIGGWRSLYLSDQNLIASGSSSSTRSMPRSNRVRAFMLNRQPI